MRHQVVQLDTWSVLREAFRLPRNAHALHVGSELGRFAHQSRSYWLPRHPISTTRKKEIFFTEKFLLKRGPGFARGALRSALSFRLAVEGRGHSLRVRRSALLGSREFSCGFFFTVLDDL